MWYHALIESHVDIIPLGREDVWWSRFTAGNSLSPTLPADVLLLVEVAETSLEYDRDEKILRYAQTQIPEVWLIEASRPR